MRFSSSLPKVPSKLPRPSMSILSRAVVNWSGDFPNTSALDRPVNNGRHISENRSIRFTEYRIIVGGSVFQLSIIESFT